MLDLVVFLGQIFTCWKLGRLEPRWLHPVVPGDGVPREIQGACHCRGADFRGPLEVGGWICYPRNQLQMAASENYDLENAFSP